MRRFNNSNGPKPLILPYTTQDPHALMVSPIDRQDAPLDFSFRRSVHLDTRASPVLPRPRAVTSVSENALRLSESPIDEASEGGFQRMLNLAQQRSGSRAYSFVSTAEHAGTASRNLLDELHAAKSDEPQATPGGANDDFEQLSRITTLENDDNLFMIPAPILPSPLSRNMYTTTPQWETDSVELSPLSSRRDPFNPALESIMGPLRSTSPDADATPKAIAKRGVSPSNEHTDDLGLSALDRLRTTFGDLLYSPADLARMVVHAAQQYMHIPAPLLSVQWWVVGLVWGPMAKRRMNDNSRYGAEMVGTRSPSLALDESMAYGTVYTSPVSGLRRRAGMAGPGKKRSGNVQHCTQEKTLLARHNPLLWVKFSITLAYAVGIAFTSGPARRLMSNDHDIHSFYRLNATYAIRGVSC
ncbi:hypothetical protein AMS68_004450 [Peltaster fructicola]|uniref:Uncharacterized protein n=1 Tax=Peltaster fructicola TaxID=286661 RepID=A0A6H0XW09_9PEZI|nr:hypothetical protein AMS68_004450 [Peltaster fructicola]